MIWSEAGLDEQVPACGLKEMAAKLLETHEPP